jgi:hypothetical protein
VGIYSKAVDLQFTHHARNVGYIPLAFISKQEKIAGVCEWGKESSVYKNYEEFLG